KPLNDQRLQIIRKIHAYMIKESREFLYCFAPKCSKRFEVTPQTFSPFFCSKECEHEIKVKEIKERSLLRAYRYSQEDLSNFRKLFGGEVTEEKMEEFFKLAKKLVRYAAKPMPVSQSQTLV
ncbi:4721_t:CDS:2, partial [Cetraspora pellucida]